jgi:hypothetical protein
MLELRIPLSQDTGKRMKIRLGKVLPDVKSSHRVEALARGLGFQTNAAMREAIRAGEVFVLADGRPFLAYLRERGFHVDVMHFYRAVANVAVERVISIEARLSLWGYGIDRFQRRDDGRRETASEHHARFLAQQEQLFSNGALDEFLLSLALLQRIPATKTIRPGTGSYRLKHFAENSRCELPCGTLLGPFYVSNGALIIAAVHAGFHYKAHLDDFGFEEVSATFNMAKPAIDDLDCEIRPNGACAQDRRRMAELQAHRRSGYGASLRYRGRESSLTSVAGEFAQKPLELALRLTDKFRVGQHANGAAFLNLRHLLDALAPDDDDVDWTYIRLQ